jgi:hypothetical protein
MRSERELASQPVNLLHHPDEPDGVRQQPRRRATSDHPKHAIAANSAPAGSGTANAVSESGDELDSLNVAAEVAMVDCTPARARAIAKVSVRTNARLMNT